jgi:NAD(P)-dependent dehydrogenase (short-subunit alcohol dehydrogenase family)
MGFPAQVLLVGRSGGVTSTLASDLAAAGYQTLVASEFGEAKELLAKRPSVLITELKLGAYNGLHLAIRARALGTPTLVIGDPDPVLEADAKRQRALYVTPPIDPQRVLGLVSELLDAAGRTRRSPRKQVQVPVLEALANDVQARLLDVSYEGMRLEAIDMHGAALPPYFEVRLPRFNFVCTVQRIWTSPATDDRAHVWCGAALTAGDETARAWRVLVDTMPGAAVAS